MKVVIRTDSSLKIGSGHVMRCLTLAEVLRETGAEVQFVCRKYAGNLNEMVRNKGFVVHELSVSENLEPCGISDNDAGNEYANWLGVSQEQDALETINVFQKNKPDWLIVDHYALGEVWEKQLRPHAQKIMVIDDLANRSHDCDLMLDQNYFIDGETRYEGLVQPSCTKLLGPKYALLRPEFAEARKHLNPRNGKVQRVFVFFGGTDSDNVTGKALEALSFPEFCYLEIDVVIGSHNPHRAEIEQQVKMRPNTSLHVQIANMAELMAQADLAIGAGGATTWERLCLGLPSLVVTIAKNQTPFTKCLHQDSFLTWLGGSKSIGTEDIRQALRNAVENESINCSQSRKGKELVPGDGTPQVAKLMAYGESAESTQLNTDHSLGGGSACT